MIGILRNVPGIEAGKDKAMARSLAGQSLRFDEGAYRGACKGTQACLKWYAPNLSIGRAEPEKKKTEVSIVPSQSQKK
ncbi:MAG: hypothetical protein JO161_03290 [Planctomycetaceae bacterium]|nr:hypothetical protein [Planctomycetaceae bacterium]